MWTNILNVEREKMPSQATSESHKGELKMGLMKYLKKTFQTEMKERNDDYKERIVQYRSEPVTIRVENPTRLDRARALGYKAKQGIIVVRQRVKRGGHTKERHIKGRRSRNQGMRVDLDKSYQLIAEERANKKYVNCEVLNSYFVAKDGVNYWYEVIMVDKDSPSIKKDKDLSWISKPNQTGRVFRGLTSSAKRARGLRNKGKGAEKLRPSKSAVFKKKDSKQRKIFS